MMASLQAWVSEHKLAIVVLLYCLTTIAASDEVTPDVLKQQEADLVRGLPGQPRANFKHYAGYVRLDDKSGGGSSKSLFYWFIEAKEKPSEQPLVLWLNGGPGASSIAFGQATELGPFRVTKNPLKLKYNKYSWNGAANLLFLDSPVGVGFSYARPCSDILHQNDSSTANSSYLFLVNWLKRFPQYNANDFYITGESYAGHYVPQLAGVIVAENKKGLLGNHINLKGVMVGNAVLDTANDDKGTMDYAWHHAIISDELYHDALDPKSPRYGSAWKYFNIKLGSIIDLYSLYTKRCNVSKTNSSNTILSDFDLHHAPAGYDPCLLAHATKYFSRADVQFALHVDVPELCTPWSPQSKNVSINYDYIVRSVLGAVKDLIRDGIRVWLYSGDTDAMVPVTATRYSLRALNLTIIQGWTPWLYRGQVGGWTVVYEGLTFVTVRGAGHMVPTTTPKQALHLFKRFLANQQMSNPADY